MGTLCETLQMVLLGLNVDKEIVASLCSQINKCI